MENEELKEKETPEFSYQTEVEPIIAEEPIIDEEEAVEIPSEQRPYETITDVPTTLSGYQIEQGNIKFNRKIFVGRYHELEEKAILRIIGISALLMLLLIIVS